MLNRKSQWVQRFFAAAVFALARPPVIYGSPSAHTYRSPDGALVAVVSARGHESDLLIRTRSGRAMAHRSYTSRDGSHGLHVDTCVWSRDSRFFVWNMQSSGGHQPWHWPVAYYSRQRRAVVSLDREVGFPVTSADFRLGRRGRITVRVLIPKRPDRGVMRTFQLR